MKPEARGYEVSTEAELVGTLRGYLTEPGHIVLEEVRSHGRARIDLLLWDGECLIGIEAKLRDWNKAIGQAALNRQCVDRSYVAMCSQNVTTTLLAEAARFGLGVMSVDAEGATVALHPDHGDPIPELRHRIFELMGDSSQ